MKVRRWLPGSALVIGAFTPSGAEVPARASTTAVLEARAGSLCRALHTLAAERRQACCGTPAASLAQACTAELSAALRRGTIEIQEAAIERCAAETELELVGCSWLTPLQPTLPKACAGLVTGRLSEGATCRSSLECKDQLHCRGLSPDRAGVCRRAAAPGARCELPADTLAAFTRGEEDPRHASCSGRCERGQCLAFAPAGGACASSALCLPGLNCLAGRCVAEPLPRLGDSCATSNVCDAGAHCSGGKCEALKEAGAACSLPFECKALACEKPAGAASGVCADACKATVPKVVTPSR